jgi:hypothetical protein
MNSRLLLTVAAAAALALPAGAQTRYTRDQAVRTCQDDIRQQATDRFGSDHINFQRLTTGASGWIAGSIRVGDGPDAELHKFSCSANFNTGYVRSARIEGAPSGYAGRDVTASAMDRCRGAVSDRIRDQGYAGVQINSLNMAPDGDRVRGFAQAQGNDRQQSFRFSCSVDPASGALRGVDLQVR